MKQTTVPLLKQFGIVGEQDLEIKINRRGSAPDGGGEIVFKCPVVKKLCSTQLTNVGKVKRIRGIAYTTRTSPQYAIRIVTAARSILNHFLPDIYIYTDASKKAGSSPGFGISIYAETTNGAIIAAEACSSPRGSDTEPDVPEDIGVKAANDLLEEVYKGGFVDSCNQYIALLFMAVGEQDVRKVLFGPLTPYTVQFLRHLKDFFEIMFKLEPKVDYHSNNDSEEYTKVLLTCVGSGFLNISKVTR